jgi:plastocyanin
MNHRRWSFCCALVASMAIVLTAPPIAVIEVSAAVSTPAPTVRIFDSRLVPAVIQIPPLSSVTWINNGHSSHVVRSTNGGWQTFSLQAGASRKVTFRTTGEFPYKVDGVLRGLVLVAAVHLVGLANPQTTATPLRFPRMCRARTQSLLKTMTHHSGDAPPTTANVGPLC